MRKRLKKKKLPHTSPLISREKNLRPAHGGGVKGPEIGRHRGHQQGAQNGQQTAAAEEPETQQQETCQESLGRLGGLGIPHGFHGYFSEKYDFFRTFQRPRF